MLLIADEYYPAASYGDLSTHLQAYNAQTFSARKLPTKLIM